MKKIWICLPFIALAAFGCDYQANLPDALDATAKVYYSNGSTPLANTILNSYNLAIKLKDGTTLLKTFAGPTAIDASTTVNGIVTDSNGQYHGTDADVGLWTTDTRTQCHDTCVDWQTDCSYDSYYNNYTCTDYCAWTATDCYNYDVTVSENFTDVASVSSYINYSAGGNTTMTTYGSAEVSQLNATKNQDNKFYTAASWTQVDRFVTPFTAAPPLASSATALTQAAPSADMKVITRGSLTLSGAYAPKHTAFEDQASLTETQMDAIRKLRAHLGVSADAILGRK